MDDVSTDLRKIGINEWKDRARDREAWRGIVKEAKAHPGGCSVIEEEDNLGYVMLDGMFVVSPLQRSVPVQMATDILKDHAARRCYHVHS